MTRQPMNMFCSAVRAFCSMPCLSTSNHRLWYCLLFEADQQLTLIPALCMIWLRVLLLGLLLQGTGVQLLCRAFPAALAA